MIVDCRCKWCGTPRRWARDSQDGSLIALDQPIYCCADGPTGYCEPSSAGERMTRDLARRAGAKYAR